MIALTVAEIAAAVDGEVVGDATATVTGVATDSRTVAPGDLFVARRGEHADGHDHAPAAVAAGAVAVLGERPVETGVPTIVAADSDGALTALAAIVRRRVDPVAVAITGSVGKTTTKDLTAAAVGSTRRVVAARGSYNNEVGVPLTLLTLAADTEVLVTELGARAPGDLATLAPLVAPDIAVVTAVAGVHLEVFGDIETVATTKRELVEALDDAGVAVLNAGDHRVAAMATHTRGRVVTYSATGPADCTAEDVTVDRLGRASFVAVTPWGHAPVRLPLAGRHHVANALAALAVAGTLEVPLEAAAAALGEAQVSPWRGEVAVVGDDPGVVVLNDAYNANPTSVAAALDTATSIERAGRVWAVLGVMAEIGSRHADEHAATGRVVAGSGVDRLVVVGDEAADLARGARQAGMPAEAVVQVATVDDVGAALDGVAPGDVVLVKASRVAGLERVAAALSARFGAAVEEAARP